MDPGEVRAASVRGVAARRRPVAGPAAAEGDGGGGPAARRAAARTRRPTAGQRDLRRGRRTQRAAPRQPQGQRGHHAAADLGKKLAAADHTDSSARLLTNVKVT